MIRTIRYYTHSSEPANDLAQECLYHIIRNLWQVDLKISFDAWALTIAKRKAVHWIREQEQNRKMDRELMYQSDDADYRDTKDWSSEHEIMQSKLSKIQSIIQKLPYSQ